MSSSISLSRNQPFYLNTPVRPLIPTSPQQVDLATVPTPQLTQIKNQLTQELSDLTNSFTQLRAAQAKFRDCIACVRDGVAGKQEGSWVSLYQTRKTRNKKNTKNNSNPDHFSELIKKPSLLPKPTTRQKSPNELDRNPPPRPLDPFALRPGSTRLQLRRIS